MENVLILSLAVNDFSGKFELTGNKSNDEE